MIPSSRVFVITGRALLDCCKLGLGNAGALVLLALCCACRSESVRPERIDLLAQFAETDSRQAVLDLDLGTAPAAAFLGAGWSPPATTGTGDSILWSAARKLIVRATIREPHDRVLLVRCATLAPPPTRAQVVAVRVNGRRIGTITVDATMREHRLLLPARYQQRGANEIAFGMRLGRGSKRLPVAYDTLRIVAPESERGPVPAVVDRRLVLPVGATVDYFARLPPLDPVLGFAAAIIGSAGPLRITVMTDTSAEATIYSGAGAPSQIDLRSYANQIVRLRFHAEGQGGAIELLEPEVTGARSAAAPRRAVPSGKPPNVVLFLVDTLRADHLGCYGYERPTSPRIDAFAREGILFTRTVAQSSWTRPAAASLLTGQYPQRHGVHTLRDGLEPSVPTLAEVVRARGYRTAGFVTNVNVAPAWGFARGFDVYRYFPEDSASPRVHAGADEIEPAIFDWIGEGAAPFFLYVHATDPHAPYAPPDPYAERFVDPSSQSDAEISARLGALKRNPAGATEADVRALVTRYDGEIAFVDAAFGRLLDELARRGLADDTLVIFTADHGEEFFDHGGFEHGRTLFRELLTIPLLMRLPQRLHAGVRSDVLARQIDVLPTVLDVLGVDPEPSLAGRSLLPLRHAGDDGSEALAETSLASRDLEGLMTGSWKFLQASRRPDDIPEVYDTVADPLEQVNRYGTSPVLLGYARQRLAAAAAAMPGRTGAERSAPVDPALIERLRALGYNP